MTTALARFNGSSVHNPSPDKSPIQKWIAKLTGASGSGSATMHHVAHGTRQYGEAGVTGFALAAVDTYRPQLSDKVQAGVAIAGAVGSVWKATEDYATDLRNVGSDAFAILLYRKSKELLEKKRAQASTTKVAGEFGDEEDPVIVASRSL